MNLINQMLLTVVLTCVAVILLGAMIFPTAFGTWLRQIDDTRYEYTINE